MVLCHHPAAVSVGRYTLSTFNNGSAEQYAAIRLKEDAWRARLQHAVLWGRIIPAPSLLKTPSVQGFCQALVTCAAPTTCPVGQTAWQLSLPYNVFAQTVLLCCPLQAVCHSIPSPDTSLSRHRGRRINIFSLPMGTMMKEQEDVAARPLSEESVSCGLDWAILRRTPSDSAECPLNVCVSTSRVVIQVLAVLTSSGALTSDSVEPLMCVLFPTTSLPFLLTFFRTSAMQMATRHVSRVMVSVVQ